jgi:uncharacterized integral membrane protein
VPETEKRQSEQLLTPRRVILGLLGLYLLLFVVLNTRRVHVNFVFFSLRTQLLIALLVMGLLGFAAGYFFGGRSRAGKKPKAADAPPTELGPGP